jgi:hypothetical protein
MSARDTSGRRWWFWLPLLGLATWLALFGDKSPAGSAAVASLPVRSTPTVRSAPAPTAAASPKAAPGNGPELIEALIARDQWIEAAPAASAASAPARRDLFSARNWNPPPPPAPVVEAPPPMAPPLPFAYLGKKLEAETWEVYLSRGEQTFIVREGQTLDGTYRIDKIAPPSMALTYLPLGQPQTLTIGDTR